MHTDGSGFDHVPYGESLDGFVLWRASRAVGAADGLNMATTLLVTAAIDWVRQWDCFQYHRYIQSLLVCSLFDHFEKVF